MCSLSYGKENRKKSFLFLRCVKSPPPSNSGARELATFDAPCIATSPRVREDDIIPQLHPSILRYCGGSLIVFCLEMKHEKTYLSTSKH
jgi:hypothetical protein